MEDTQYSSDEAIWSDPANTFIPQRRLLRNHTPLFQWFQWLCHSLVIWLTVYWTSEQTASGFDADYRFLALVTILSFSAVSRFVGFYRRYVVGWLWLWRTTEAWLITLVFVAISIAVIGNLRRFDPTIIGEMAIIGLLAHALTYSVMKKTATVWKHSLATTIPAIVVGTGSTAEQLVEKINRNSFIADEVIGILKLNSRDSSWVESDIPVLGEVSELSRVLKLHSVDRCYVSLPIEQSEQVRKIQEELLEFNVDVIWAPDIFSLDLLNPCVREMGGIPLISLSESPLISGPKAYAKSLMDVSIAILLVILLSPLLLIIAALIKTGSPGPVFYRQQRHGWDGKEFGIWKFRSMYLHDESQGIKQATKGDDRITPIGRFIRRTSIDELPQLLNVLEGNMSLVGPRPHAVQHNNEFSTKLRSYLHRHRVKPGMTGWAQVHGHRGETDTLEKMNNRLEHDLYYINRWSLKLDLLILLMTPLSLLTPKAF